MRYFPSGQPFMLVQNIGLQFIGKKLVIFYVGVAIEADEIIVKDRLFQVLIRPGVDLVGVGIMTHPAGEILSMFFGMNTGLELRFDLLEFEFCIFFISAVTVDTVGFRLHSEVSRVGEGEVIFRVAVGAFEFPMVGDIEYVAAEDQFGEHPFIDVLF